MNHWYSIIYTAWCPFCQAPLCTPVDWEEHNCWYHNQPWQDWEKEADEDREVGRYEVFESMDDFIEALKEEE